MPGQFGPAEYSARPGLKPSMRIHLAAGLLFGAALHAAEPLRFASGPSQVALVELYTSEGCSSCPPADAWLAALRDKPGLWSESVPVAFHVDYWNGLGWKDRLSSRASTDRQYAYAEAWGNRSVYTPCFVRNGAEWRPRWGNPGKSREAGGTLSVEIAEDGLCRAQTASPGAGAAALRTRSTWRTSAGESPQG